MTKPLAISLFTGAGGLDLGLESAGFKIAGSIEINEDCVRTIAHNRPSWKHLGSDIFKVEPSSVLSTLKLKRREVSLLSGGPPCQPFSKAGMWAPNGARRLEDPRAKTIGAYFEMLEHLLPRAFIFENVKGILSAKDDSTLRKIKANIDRINKRQGTAYSLQAITLNAADFGVPQFRERVFLVGSRDGKTFKQPAPTHGPKSLNSEPWRTCWDAIGHLDEEEWAAELNTSGKWQSLLPTIPEGQNYLWHTPKGEGAPLFGWRRKYWSFLLKLAKNQPAWTIQASPGPSTGPFHWKSRNLSIEELCRIQTFPEGFEVLGNYRSARKQLGNAVPSALAEVLGIAIRKQFFGEALRKSPLLIPERRRNCPSPERLKGLPRDFAKGLKQELADHPGSGLGPSPRAAIYAGQ